LDDGPTMVRDGTEQILDLDNGMPLQSGPSSMTLPSSVTSVTARMLFVSTEHAEEDRGGKGRKAVGSRAARAK
jgi:hypothetical protein